MTTKRYNLSNLDVTVQNLSDLGELEYMQFNDSARSYAEKLMNGLRGKSPDFVQRVGEWAYDMGTSHKRKAKPVAPQFENTDLFQARDEQGRYSQSQGDGDMLSAVDEHNQERREASSSAPTDPNVLQPGNKWAIDRRTGTTIQVPREASPASASRNPVKGGQ